MYLFDDEFFKKEYNSYYDLREKGLKKEANEKLEELMEYFDSLDDDMKRSICYKMCRLYLDTKEISELQFPFSHRIIAILAMDCEENKMPQMRWYYQLTGDKKMLKKAFEQKKDDEKTIHLMVESFLYELWNGAHHMPYCCLIEKDKSDELLDNLRTILESCELPDDIKKEYEYYFNLYSDWWRFDKDLSTKGFLEWCVKNKRDYDWVKEYCFDKD